MKKLSEILIGKELKGVEVTKSSIEIIFFDGSYFTVWNPVSIKICEIEKKMIVTSLEDGDYCMIIRMGESEVKIDTSGEKMIGPEIFLFESNEGEIVVLN